MKLTVIVPVLNEEATLGSILDSLKTVDVVDEIIVVDDGSNDCTPDIAREHAPEVRLIRHEQNRGKGAAIRTGLTEATGDYVVIQDGDMEYNPQDYVKMVERLKSTGADVVYGSRILGRNKFSYPSFYLGGRLLSILANILYGLSITDEPTCYKMMPLKELQRMNLQCTGFEFCPEVTAKAARLGLKFTEVPIEYAPRSVDEGKKIRWTDGLIAIWTLLRFRLWQPNPSNRS